MTQHRRAPTDPLTDAYRSPRSSATRRSGYRDAQSSLKALRYIRYCRSVHWLDTQISWIPAGIVSIVVHLKSRRGSSHISQVSAKDHGHCTLVCVCRCTCSVPEGRGSLVIPPRRRREGMREGREAAHATTGGSQSTQGNSPPGVSPPSPTLEGRDPAGSLSPQYKSGHAGNGKGSRLASLLSRPPINTVGGPPIRYLASPPSPKLGHRTEGTSSVCVCVCVDAASQRGGLHRQPDPPIPRSMDN